MKINLTLSNKLLYCCSLIWMCWSFSAIQAQNICIDPVCGTDDPVNNLTWLNDFANQTYICTITQYTQTSGDSYFLISEYQDPLIADIPTGVLYDCEGNWVCTLGGEILPEWGCSFQGINLNTIGGKVIYTNGCNDASALPGLADDCYSECLAEPDAYCLMVYDPVCACNGETYTNACEAQIQGNISWTAGACGTFCNEEVCEVTDPVNNLLWLNDFSNQSDVCTITQYDQGFGATYFMISKFPNPLIADLETGVLYDCEGNWICTLGGELAEDICLLAGLNLESIGGQVIFSKGCEVVALPGVADDCYSECLVEPNAYCPTVYEPVCGCDGQTYGNACEAQVQGNISWTTGECGTFCNEEVCSVTDPVNNLPWLNTFANQPSICTITQYTQAFGDSYFLVSEYQDPMIADIEIGILYDCEGNAICLVGGETTEEAQCDFQGINLEGIGGKVIHTKGCNDASPLPGLADDCYSECLVEPNAACPTVYEPVCACNGQTYSNACFAEQAGFISWTIGECTAADPLIVMAPRVFLQGALLNTTDDMMKDELRQANLIPVLEPYTDLASFGHIGTGGGETTTASVLANSGPDAIVDWVYLELRSETDPAQVITTCSALVQRDGDVVGQDGVSPIEIPGLSADNYYVAIKHRNHLGAMTAQPISLSNSATTIDFSTIETWGDYAQVDMGAYNALWGGNVNSDGQILFQGANNELNDSFFEIIGAASNTGNMPNYIYINYNQSDVDLNAESIYQGVGNDINMIFFNIISHPESSTFSNFIVVEQIP